MQHGRTWYAEYLFIPDTEKGCASRLEPLTTLPSGCPASARMADHSQKRAAGGPVLTADQELSRALAVSVTTARLMQPAVCGL